MNGNMNKCVESYKLCLENDEIQIAYKMLFKYVLRLKGHLSVNLPQEYSFGNISPGHMDYTYFPLFNNFLRNRKLRFGVVLNHREMQFELWLMGRNAAVQNEYWQMFKDSEWSKGDDRMPEYSVLKLVLEDSPDFDDLAKLSEKIEKTLSKNASAIIEYICKKE